MRALVVRGPKDVAVESVPDPTPAADQLVLRVHSCGICGTDLNMVESGLLPPGSVLGHEFAGEVLESAAGFRAGERVCALPALSCGKCARCRTGLGAYCERQRTIGLGSAPGALAEYVAVAAREAVRIPAAIDAVGGALVEPLAVALHAVRSVRVRRGDHVVILGGGPIGLGALLWSLHFGARAVLVSDPAPERRALARRLGATAVEPDHLAAALPEFAEAGPDVVLEAVGVPGLIQKAIESVGFRGRIAVVGVCMRPDTLQSVPAILREATLHFVMAYEKDDFQYTIDMLEAGRIEPYPMVTDQLPLTGIPAAFAELRGPSAHCKVLYRAPTAP